MVLAEKKHSIPLLPKNDHCSPLHECHNYWQKNLVKLREVGAPFSFDDLLCNLLYNRCSFLLWVLIWPKESHQDLLIFAIYLSEIEMYVSLSYSFTIFLGCKVYFDNDCSSPINWKYITIMSWRVFSVCFSSVSLPVSLFPLLKQISPARKTWFMITSTTEQLDY